MIAKPMRVAGVEVSSACICKVIDALANTPRRFIGMDLVGALPNDRSFHWQQEVMNRLLQRWRKLGLAEFSAGRWALTCGAWDVLQCAQRLVATPDGRGEG